jgi:hypothetical protein
LTSGQLNVEEYNRLKEHLEICASCREALREYDAIIDAAIPAIGANEAPPIDAGPGWSQEDAEKIFFESLKRAERRQNDAREVQSKTAASVHRPFVLSPGSTWRHVWMLYAAGILLFITLGLCAYWVAMRRGSDLASNNAPIEPVNKTRDSGRTNASLEEQLSDTAHELATAQAEIAERDRALLGVRRQLEHQSEQMRHMQDAQDLVRTEARSGEAAGEQALGRQQTEWSQKLQAAQANVQALEQQLKVLTDASSRADGHAKALEARVSDLTKQLQDREAEVDQKNQLLAHDRDIRELMGARDLYIAEVYDVADNGTTKKPYGRVFYTKGKSLIFYAYDLDQAGIKPARTFQAWGRRGPDRQSALSLGIFYEDNSSKKRWVLKLDDAKTLSQIDAVFVTVEPNGGSHKPSGKPLLFAYLRVDPNHP